MGVVVVQMAERAVEVLGVVLREMNAVGVSQRFQLFCATSSYLYFRIHSTLLWLWVRSLTYLGSSTLLTLRRIGQRVRLLAIQAKVYAVQLGADVLLIVHLGKLGVLHRHFQTMACVAVCGSQLLIGIFLSTFCVAPGVGCVDNSAGIPVCNIPIPTATRTIATTQPTTTRTSTTLSNTTAIISTAAVTTTTVTSLRGPTTTISAGGSLPPTPNFTQSFPPEPTSSSPYRNVTIAADDQSIVYSNGFWETSTACEGSAKKTSVIGGQMDCQFVGTAIYISTLVGPSGGVYTVTIDGQSVDVSTFEFEMRDGISTEVAAREKCEVTWSAWGLADRVHTVRLVYRGAATGPNVAVGNSREVPSVGITRFTFVLLLLSATILDANTY